MAKKIVIYSFEKGYKMIPTGKAREFREEIINIIGAKNIQAFYNRLKGWKNIPLPIYYEINKLFAKYGIKDIEAIWEITEE